MIIYNSLNIMLLVIHPKELNIDYVNFLETRKNILMEGTFTKIIYSNCDIVINGIYLRIPFNDYGYDKSHSRIILKDNKINRECINNISKYEHYILSYFKHINSCEKKQRCLLKDQLSSMTFKVYRENYNSNAINNCDILLKISGIWEDATDYGLTYKIMETFPYN